MSLTALTADVENITKLDDNPTQQAGMTPAVLKSRFDKGAADIKAFINGTLLPELTAALSDKLSSAELTSVSQAILASAQASGLFDGNGIASVSLLSGSHAPGTTDTYRITFTDNTTCDFTVYNGADGLGQGDMLASVYDPANKNADAFSMTNMAEGTTNKIFTAAERTKLAGIAAGAEVNVNADWNASSGDAQILNKPGLTAFGGGYAVCDTAAAMAAKTVTLTGYALTVGGIVGVKFTNGNTAASPTLDIGGTGAKPILIAGAATGNMAANYTAYLQYDGTNYNMLTTPVDVVVRSATAPSNTSALWIDTGSSNVPKYYNGTSWVPLVAVWG
jgi:hypothetical protein